MFNNFFLHAWHDDIFTLTTREQSIAIWVLLFLLFSLSKEGVRSSVFSILKTIFSAQIFIPLLCAAGYVAIEVWVLFKVGYFDISLTKELTFWFFGTALALFFSTGLHLADEIPVKKIIFSHLKMLAVFEFIFNFYTFPFWVEFFLWPLLVFFMLVAAVGEQKSDASSKKIGSIINMIVGGGVMACTLFLSIQNARELASIGMLLDFFFPFFLTLGFIPFLYLLALYATYDSSFVFLRMGINKDPSLVFGAKWAILRSCGLSLRRINNFRNHHAVGLRKITDISEVQVMLNAI